MKTTFTKLSFTCAALLAIQTGFGQTDLVPGINYSYDPPGPDGIIHNITVDACNNDSDPASAFTVSMYLYDSGSGNHWTIGDYNVTGLAGYTCGTISNWDIDINNTSGIPDGTYRLGIWVDSHDDITETDDNNNFGLLNGNINYSASAVGIKSAVAPKLALQPAMPNPAKGSTRLSFHLETAGVASLEIFDLTGKKVSTVANTWMAAGDHSYVADISMLEPGIYFFGLQAGQQRSMQKLVVQ